MTIHADSSGIAVSPALARRLAVGELVLGVVSIGLGLAAVFWPKATLLVVSILFGIQLLATGIHRIAVSFMSVSVNGWIRALSLIMGIFIAVAGLVCIRNPFTSLLVIAVLISLGWFTDGVVDLVRAMSGDAGQSSRTVIAIGGVLSILGAMAILYWPDLALTTLTSVGGWILVFLGIAQAMAGFRALR
jgi:uncharacterized membrane protein HdeD (DUF308 family)